MEKFNSNISKAKKIVISGLLTGTTQASLYVLSIVTINAISTHYGSKVLSEWFVLLSFLPIIACLDLGLGNATVATAIASRNSLNQNDTSIKATSLAITITIAVVIMSCAMVILEVINTFSIIQCQICNFQDISIYILFAALSIPLMVFDKISLLEEKYTKLKMVETFALVTSLIIFLYSKKLVIAFSAIMFIRYAPVMIAKALLLITYLKRHTSLGNITLRHQERLLNTARNYFIMSLVGAVAISSDTLLLAYMGEKKGVVDYSLAQRLLVLPTMLTGFFAFPAWTYCAKYLNESNSAHVGISILKKVTLFSLPGITLAIVLFKYNEIIYPAIFNDGLVPSSLMITMYCLWACLSTFNAVLSPFINSMGVESALTKLSLIMMVANVAISVLLIHIVGPAGAIIGTIVSTFTIITIPCIIMLFQCRSRLATKVDQ